MVDFPSHPEQQSGGEAQQQQEQEEKEEEEPQRLESNNNNINNNDKNDLPENTPTTTMDMLLHRVTKLQQQLEEELMRDERELMVRLRTTVETCQNELKREFQHNNNDNNNNATTTGQVAMCRMALDRNQERMKKHTFPILLSLQQQLQKQLQQNQGQIEVVSPHVRFQDREVTTRELDDQDDDEEDDDDDDGDVFDTTGSNMVVPFGRSQHKSIFIPSAPSFAPITPFTGSSTSICSSVGDESSVANNSVASSTFGDDRRTVRSQLIKDKHGDQGQYTGVVLKSSGLPHGSGHMTYDGGWTYDGNWCHGWWHGRGVAHFQNGDSYCGEYRFNKRHGHGKYRWADDRVYDGEFVDEKRHGKGIFQFPDGARYEGEFSKGQREGFGTNTFADGGYYTGNLVKGRYEGFGGTICVCGHVVRFFLVLVCVFAIAMCVRRCR
jgi:hypothetical protein